MTQSLSKILLHVVFSTKNRKPWIPSAIRDDLHAYLAGTCRGIGGQAFRVGGTDDHVHIACSLPRTLTVSKLVEEIKTSTSIWMKEQDGGPKSFAWQAGYGAFSLGQSQLPAILQYIDRQQEHHKKCTFREEFLELLRRYGIEFDERYLWD
jgi:REP-associated tyrosine transposase